jgi:excisionase family DNA binding protein
MVYHADESINVREAARQCGRNAETIRRWIWDGKLPAQKLGNQLFIKKKDLALFCRETAIAYRAEPDMDILKKAKELRGQIRAGTDTGFNIKKDITEMREERMHGINIIEKGDFLERAIQFRKKLKARGYHGVDATNLVSRAREERTHELRQGLR